MDLTRTRTRDPVEWLETCPDFSSPIANQLREWILEWEPDLTESVKWNMLCFSGRKLICGISACKKHAGLSFFRGTELPDPEKLFEPGSENNTNICSLRIVALQEVNRAALRDLLHAAVELDAEPAIPPPPKRRRAPLPLPESLAKALKRDRVAAVNFEKLSPTCRREYIVWVGTAKLPETQKRRLEQTLKALRSGLKWIDRKKA
jgi:Uncharacterized protein conserved in bacteria